MSIEHIHLSQQAKDQLIRLKRTTGIDSWNVLCRWGFCLSLAEAHIPAEKRIPADSNVEMTWRVFAGAHGSVYMALLKERCVRDGLGVDESTLAAQFRLHLHRGIAYLVSDKELNEIEGLVAMALAPPSLTSPVSL